MKDNRIRGIDREKTLSKKLGADRVPGSGCGWQKGDLVTKKYCIQSKYVKKIAISEKLLQGVVNDAKSQQKKPVLFITFRNHFTCVIVPTKRFRKNMLIDITSKSHTAEERLDYHTAFKTDIPGYQYWRTITEHDFRSKIR